MQEDFLHYIWQHKKFDIQQLTTVANEVVTIKSVGQHNHNSGPDFFNAQLYINQQLWAGNVEIHVKSSDWFVHSHEQDKAYDNVILHVVWEHDTDVYRKDNTIIPTLQLKDFVNANLIQNYKALFTQSNKWIYCEDDFGTIDDFTLSAWLERLFFERLQRKSNAIDTLLNTSKNAWEAVLFKMLAKNFGLKVNGDAFLSLAQSVDFSIVRKLGSNQTQLEALLFGQSALLNDDVQNAYFQNLEKEYNYLKHKFKLSNEQVLPIRFFRLRPPNFPTIRLSQLASLYYKHQNLFSKIIEAKTIDELYAVFSVSVSSFWETHYTFSKTSKASKKALSKPFIDLLLINTVIPIKFAYAKANGKFIDSEIVDITQQISAEKNTIVSAFKALKQIPNSALYSQALIQLKTEYCNKKKCLQCAVGNSLIIK